MEWWLGAAVSAALFVYLFYALWISDLFMERVMGNKTWSLFCPDKCPGLSDCHSDAYRELYLKYIYIFKNNLITIY